MTTVKAVILAAGAGSRMGALAALTPKALLPIDGRDGSPTFLDWHLRCLEAAGVGELYLVGNSRTVGAPLVSDVAHDWVLNPTDPAASGSAHSLSYAWQSPHRILDGRSRVIVMDADIVYDPTVLIDLLAAPVGRSKLSVSAVRRDDGEEVLVFGDPPRRLGKGLVGSAAVAGLPCLGEATGITLWEARDHDALAAETASVLREHGPCSEHEAVTQRMLDGGGVDAVVFGPERAFLEVDTAEDYRRLVADVAPRLLASARHDPRR